MTVVLLVFEGALHRAVVLLPVFEGVLAFVAVLPMAVVLFAPSSAPGATVPAGDQLVGLVLKRKFMSCSHGQELGQLADLVSDWLFTIV